MTFWEYYRDTKGTTKLCLRVTGILFTTVCAGILVLTELKGLSSIAEVVKMFIICILLGNGFGFLLCLIAMIVGYRNAKAMMSIFESVPKWIRFKYEIKVAKGSLTSKYNYMSVYIYTTNPNYPIFFLWTLSKKRVRISIVNKLPETVNYAEYRRSIYKRYKEQQIELIGWGLSKIISREKWKKVTIAEVEDYFTELIVTAKKEELEILNAPDRHYDQTSGEFQWGDKQSGK
ncbi:MAG: hypothetical protein LBT50_00345 [Prevotellaceae bacterium]|jgi:hypothetical protein|nr:hypothetical protein [Prevotellaceae bacterium]